VPPLFQNFGSREWRKALNTLGVSGPQTGDLFAAIECAGPETLRKAAAQVSEVVSKTSRPHVFRGALSIAEILHPHGAKLAKEILDNVRIFSRSSVHFVIREMATMLLAHSYFLESIDAPGTHPVSFDRKRTAAAMESSFRKLCMKADEQLLKSNSGTQGTPLYFQSDINLLALHQSLLISLYDTKSFSVMPLFDFWRAQTIFNHGFSRFPSPGPGVAQEREETMAKVDAISRSSGIALPAPISLATRAGYIQSAADGMNHFAEKCYAGGAWKECEQLYMELRFFFNDTGGINHLSTDTRAKMLATRFANLCFLGYELRDSVDALPLHTDPLERISAMNKVRECFQKLNSIMGEAKTLDQSLPSPKVANMLEGIRSDNQDLFALFRNT
jgi:hypothetical protein